MKPLIVFVDDEPNNLTVFEASMPPEWEVKTFTLPTQALQELSNLGPAVILTDQRMPEMNGVRNSSYKTYLNLSKVDQNE